MSPTFWLIFNALFGVFNVVLAALAATAYLAVFHVGCAYVVAAFLPHFWRQRRLLQEAQELAALNTLLSDSLSQLNLRASIMFANAKRERARWKN